MIFGYVQNNCFEEDLCLFHLTCLTDIVPNESLFEGILSACSHLEALDMDFGIWIHRYLNQSRILLSNYLSTILSGMYAKCGHLKLAKDYCFDDRERPSVLKH